MRYYIYNKFNKTNNNSIVFGLNGYINKDIENELNQLANKSIFDSKK